ncbi:FUSC family membrane protein [Hymenobacter chitinivorans]|uniref:Putative membrane protein (TIGR01666 family) n=1 Tax=Hymenobacter chitinivorans DSM 11115 TaxID=1121954 RepID=A0A2M9B9X6_9BACT|nr:FUSC family membrane protein [Hymenobacter chitinivorans]PJJ54748.1 putative membrane protein (TIGR01666 family) [Hymenobacter chitinivorans DSM 11115]
MNEQTRKIHYFFFGQDFSDGLRITFAILLPALVFSWLGQFETGLTLSTGAVCISITDLPGPIEHKRNGMLYGNLCLFLVGLLTGLLNHSNWLLGLEVAGLTFVFTMFLVYGARAGAIGSAALLVMILNMDKPLTPAQVLPHSLLLLAGGVWYTVLSLLLHQVRPHRAARQALAECIHAIAQFLTIKADFYTLDTTLDEDYRHLVAQQVVVSEKQDAVREVLFKSRQIVNESTSRGRRLVVTFIDVVDLYEHITATYYDYAALRAQFGHTGILGEVAELIRHMAVELDHIGAAIQANRPYTTRAALKTQLETLKARIDAIGEEGSAGSNLVLKKILVNLRNLTQRVNDILNYFDSAKTGQTYGRELEYSRFVSHDEVDLKSIRDNLTFSSSVFRHAIRMTLACSVGFLASKLLFPGYHSYWILMTTTYMLKPGFSLTKERNYQRILGTLAGGVIGVLILWLIPEKTVQFALMVVLMVISYSFQRTNYIVTVTCLTPFILIMFSLLGVGYLGVIEERITDTFIGCAIAFSAGYLLFPKWEADQLQVFMRDVLQANLNYLLKLAESISGVAYRQTDYKLVRKNVYVSSANLSAAFQRMLSEPKSTRRNSSEVHEFVVLNHILASNIASITSTAPGQPLVPATRKPLRQALLGLARSLKKLDEQAQESATDFLTAEPEAFPKQVLTPEENLLREQLEFIQKISSDISKTTEAILAK